MDFKLTYQQQLVFERLQDTWERILKYNEDLDKRATLITAASSVIVGIVAAAKFLPKENNSSDFESVLLGCVCGASVLMYWNASIVWSLTKKPMPGTFNVRELYEEYIAQDENTAFNNALIDLSDAVKVCTEENMKKSQFVDNITLWFRIQIGILGFSIAWAGISNIVDGFVCKPS